MAIVLGLTLSSLTACGKHLNEVVKVPTPVFPPDELLKDCPNVPENPLHTNADLAKDRNAWKNSSLVCSADKKALREWRDSWKNTEK